MGVEEKTEQLIFWSVQYATAAREAFVFKRDLNDMDQILINFVGSSGWTPKRGDMLTVTYCFKDGCYRGIKMLPKYV